LSDERQLKLPATVTSFVHNGIRYRSEYRRCGDATCTKCPHGPYWLAYWWDENGRNVLYIGRKLPSSVTVPSG
jgi:hypothetical protein